MYRTPTILPVASQAPFLWYSATSAFSAVKTESPVFTAEVAEFAEKE